MKILLEYSHELLLCTHILLPQWLIFPRIPAAAPDKTLTPNQYAWNCEPLMHLKFSVDGWELGDRFYEGLGTTTRQTLLQPQILIHPWIPTAPPPKKQIP